MGIDGVRLGFAFGDVIVVYLCFNSVLNCSRTGRMQRTSQVTIWRIRQAACSALTPQFPGIAESYCISSSDRYSTTIRGLCYAFNLLFNIASIGEFGVSTNH
jgi:hypothetical protein